MSEKFAGYRGCGRVRHFAFGLIVLAGSQLAQAYGPEGHLIAGRAAEDLLCTRAVAEIASLSDGYDLGELGLWADRIRSDPRYTDSGSWHYMNIASDVRLEEFEHPEEGDVIWAVEHFAGKLRDESLGPEERSAALKFLVHFVVDLHQPLHVGLAEDRGGNSIALEFRGEQTNLHRLWDTHAIEWTGLSVLAYTHSVRDALAKLESPVALDPLIWAGESLALRPAVYTFGEEARQPEDSYLDFAAMTTHSRLVLAARRLGGTLNAVFCG